jgi:hypothetical protein
MRSGSVISAITPSCPPQSGQLGEMPDGVLHGLDGHSNQQMQMVGHPAVGVDLSTVILCGISHATFQSLPVLFIPENRLPGVTSEDDVVETAVNMRRSNTHLRSFVSWTLVNQACVSVGRWRRWRGSG